MVCRCDITILPSVGREKLGEENREKELRRENVINVGLHALQHHHKTIAPAWAIGLILMGPWWAAYGGAGWA